MLGFAAFGGAAFDSFSCRVDSCGSGTVFRLLPLRALSRERQRVEKFDLTALSDNTVPVLVSESGPSVFTSTDSFNSVVAQIRQAAAIWNGVASSSLRVAFGGFENSATPQNTPGIDVVFADLPPGVEGLTGPIAATTPTTAADGTQFFPIVRSVMYLSKDLTAAPGPSFDQSFLLTTLHELGHALGLQHPFTSATMSQATTRATTLAHPLDNDDIAGLSVLYPAAGMKQLGSISGQITAGGQGVHLASVVAIAPGTGAVSAVTNQDGTYRIDGIPPGNYAVYMHTMPPDADVLGPWNSARGCRWRRRARSIRCSMVAAQASAGLRR